MPSPLPSLGVIMETINTFDPVLYSDEENDFLLSTIGLPPVVALKSVPAVVNPAAVAPILNRVYELEELKKHEGLDWAGIEALKGAIKVYQRETAKWVRDKQRSRRAPRFPSLYSYDSKGRPHRGGPGSDSGRVRTYFGPAGERIPFEVQLQPDNLIDWTAPGFTEKPTEVGLRVDATTNRIECLVPVPTGVCGHTESYKAESRASYNAARARMSKHLRKASESVEAHRELHTNEFGSTTETS